MHSIAALPFILPPHPFLPPRLQPATATAHNAARNQRRPDRMRSLHQIHHRQHRQRQPRLHHRGPRRGARRRQGEHGAAPQAEARGSPQRESSPRGRVRLRVKSHAIKRRMQYTLLSAHPINASLCITG